VRAAFGSSSVIDRLVRSEDFERVLGTRSRVHSPHFAVHHLAEPPQRPRGALAGELSTAGAEAPALPVDDLPRRALAAGPRGLWLGVVVPKRHARRAVTRSLLKRQIRTAVQAQARSLDGGLWVVRLKAPFDREHFPSAASAPLKRAVRAELEQLMCHAAGAAPPADRRRA
jgi:ribonuclease P protein component